MAYVKCPRCGYDKVEYKTTGLVCGKCGCGKDDESPKEFVFLRG